MDIGRMYCAKFYIDKRLLGLKILFLSGAQLNMERES